MKRKLSKEEFDKLPEALKASYKESSGSYILDIEDDDAAVEALRRAKENESEAHKETKRQLKEMQNKLDELTNEGSRKRGDVEALEASWKQKYTARETELTTKLTKLQDTVVNSMKESVISTLANKLVKPESHRLFKKAVEDRFSVEMNGETPSVRILTPDGKPSAMGIEEFEKEILANKEYSPIIIASRASGGAGKPDKLGGALQTNSDGKAPNLATMDPRSLAAAIKSKHHSED